MHSYTAPSGATYHHNGDFSGDILVHREHVLMDDRDLIGIPAEDVLALAAEYLRLGAINRIEQLTTAGILQAVIGL